MIKATPFNQYRVDIFSTIEKQEEIERKYGLSKEVIQHLVETEEDYKEYGDILDIEEYNRGKEKCIRNVTRNINKYPNGLITIRMHDLILGNLDDINLGENDLERLGYKVLSLMEEYAIYGMERDLDIYEIGYKPKKQKRGKNEEN